MSSQGPNLAGTGASVDRASATAWTTPGNITADDASTASAAVPTDYLVASNFGFSIPSTATIQGVTVEVQAHETGTGSSNYVVQLHSDTTPTLIGSSKNSPTVTGTTPTTRTHGGTTDVWGAALTPAIVNASGFGVSLWSTDTTNTLLVDFIRITIEYGELNAEDGDTWSDGIPQRSVAGPIAKAAATLATVVGLALGLHSPVDEIASPPSIPGGSAASAATQRAEVAPVTWRWGANDDIVPQPAPVALDAGEWTPAPAAAVRWVQQPWVDSDLLPVALDETQWTPVWVPYRVFVQGWGDDGSYVPVAASPMFDEDGWAQPRVSPGARWTSAWSADDELGTAAAPIAEDEGWAAPVVVSAARWVALTWGQDEAVTAAPLTPSKAIGAGTQRAVLGRAILPQWGAGDEFVPAAAPATIVEDDGWSAPVVAPVVRWLVIPWGQDEAVTAAPTTIVEDDAWLTAIVDGGGSRWIPLWSAQDAIPVLPVDEQYEWRGAFLVRAPAQQPWFDDGSTLVTPPAPLVDELYHWVAQFRPTPAAFLQPHAPDEVVTPPAPLVDELYHWVAQFRPTPAAFLQPHAPDEVVTPPAPLVDELYHWVAQFRPTPAAFLQPHAPDEVVTPPAPLVDELYHWIAQFRPTPAAFLQPHAEDEIGTPPEVSDAAKRFYVDARGALRVFGGTGFYVDPTGAFRAGS